MAVLGVRVQDEKERVMNVGELVDQLQKYDKDLEVCVKVTHCASPYTGEPVVGPYRGFDWEAGKLMLQTESPLLRMRETCRRCGMYGVKAAERISSRVVWTDMNAGDMAVCVYLDGKKKFSVPFNTRVEVSGKEKQK